MAGQERTIVLFRGLSCKRNIWLRLKVLVDGWNLRCLVTVLNLGNRSIMVLPMTEVATMDLCYGKALRTHVSHSGSAANTPLQVGGVLLTPVG